MIKHQITGLGPVQPDGSRDIFTVADRPYHLSKEMLATAPAIDAVITVGDYLYDENGSISLTWPPVDLPEPVSEELAEAEKKVEEPSSEEPEQSLSAPQGGSIVDGGVSAGISGEKPGEE